MAYLPIENYALIGDLYTVALVSTDASIDFMCMPYFDSPTVFAALLDDKRGGCFRIRPVVEKSNNKQLYLPDSNILLTRFLSEDVIAEVSDFMTAQEWATDEEADHALVRHVKTVHGTARYEMLLAPRFNYARSPHRIEREADGALLLICDCSAQPALRLRSSVPVTIRPDGDITAEFTLSAGEKALFVLERAVPGKPSPSAAPHYTSMAFKNTMDFWRSWIGRSNYRGRWREMVNRSALALKLLTSQQHGSLIAAPTFGLPELVGGVRNWDYRYTWIRDASFTLYALMRLGYTAEADHFMRWLTERCLESGDDGLQLMYGIGGQSELTEEVLPHLEGYRGSKPVRIGNAAYTQRQLDIYGELMDSVYLYDKYCQRIDYELWEQLVRLVDLVCKSWHLPDNGIWEVRGPQRQFVFSRLMCWVAVDRAVRLALKRSYPAPVGRWLGVRDEIYKSIYRDFRHPTTGAFVQSPGSSAMDAATLLMPMVRFIGPTDPIWLATMRMIETRLVEDSLVYRYRGEVYLDGIEGPEGTFSMCSFWYAECLSRSGAISRARLVFEKMLSYSNHVGLYAEELGLHGEHLGNFPQAFTHLALISAAFDLDQRLSDPASNNPGCNSLRSAEATNDTAGY